MVFLRLLFYGGLIFIISSLTFITTALSADENTKNITNTSIIYDDYVIPMHYNVTLLPYLGRNEEDTYINYIFTNLKKYVEEHQANGRVVFYGEINAAIHILRPTKKISLNSANSIYHVSAVLIKRDVKVGSKDSPFTETYIEYDNVTQILVLHLKSEILSENYTLKIKFLNAINILEDNNIFLTTTYIKKSGNEKWWNETQISMIEVQRLFPCWDGLSISKMTIKSDFDVSIKHYCNYSVFSNMPIRQQRIYKLNNTEECMRWTYFGIKSAMPAHLAIIISPINFFPGCGTDRIHFWQNPNSNDIEFAERVSNKVIMKLKYEWFRRLEMPKLQLIAISNFRNDININFGLVAIRETSIFYNKSLHSIAHKVEVARLITRGITYQWFDNLINRTSSNLWLNDGLITLIGMNVMNDVNVLERRNWDIVDSYSRNLDIVNLFIVQTQYESFQLDDCNFTQTLTSEISSYPEINSLSSYYRSIKAPLILRMLQYLITKEVFWKSVRRFVNMHAFDSDDFWYFMERAMYEKNLSQPDITAIKYLINEWEKKYANCPILKIIRNYNEKTMHITIENYYDYNKNDQLKIPITFTTQSNLNFMNFASPLREKRLILIMSPLGAKVDIAEDGWVMFNIQQSGYYRVNYDLENWQRIAKYLNSMKYTKIHVLNRAKIIDDAFHFMVTHQLDSFMFWNLAKYLAQETNYIAWYPMLKALEYMSSIFSFTDKRIDDIKEKLNNMLSGLLLKIKYEESFQEDEFTKCLRQEVIKWACILGDPTCQRIAYKKLVAYITKLKTNKDYKLLPWSKEWIYCQGLVLADFDTWHTIKQMALMKNHDNRILEYLACPKNNDYLINEYLRLLRPQNNEIHTNSFFLIIAKHVKNDTVLTTILTQFETLKPKDVSTMAALTIIINHVYSRNQIRKIKKFMIHIIDRYAFVRAKEISYTENRTCKTSAIEDFITYKNLRKYLKLVVKRKLRVRLSEIRKHINHLRKF